MFPSIELAPDVVDVWMAPLDVNADEMNALLHRLSPSEQKRVGALLEERAVHQYVVSRAMQRQLLAGYVGGSPADISFGVVGMGKPTLSKPNDIGLTFNTTHSGNLVIIVVTANRDVGVDVEKLKPIPRALQVAKRFFSEDEYRMLSALPEDEIDLAFLSIWVRREGTAKARGDSVWRGLASWKNGEIDREQVKKREWTVVPLDLGPDFVGVVVARGNDWRVVMRGAPSVI
ncbi:MAG: 4'-phosphopantetheinyl transferase superfamily protein [Gemmatimonadaceae bacterium]|nr:4'-phosphopantetheinyl transferase superfamily protein [Gemmatimonadaceae bacterium]